MLPPTWTFEEYTKKLAELPWDIAVAPLVDSPFTRCKSSIKFFEYSMCKIPVIASRVYPYNSSLFGEDVISHEATGLLVEPNEWFSALETLITNSDKRKLLGENAYNHIRSNLQYNHKFSDRIESVIKALG